MDTLTLKQLLRTSSRTFAIGIERLPKRLNQPMTTAYLLLRVSDYLEDNVEMPAAQKVDLLNKWEQVLEGKLPLHELNRQLTFPDQPTPDAVVALNVDKVYASLQSLPSEVRGPIIKHVGDSTRGMARWVARGPDVQNENDMDDYMHEVAGRVGYLVTEIFAWYSHFIRSNLVQLIPLARECGLALQTVNIIRGLRDDFERGWIFIPESFCEEAGLPREALFDPAHRDQAMVVIDRLANKADRHLENAKTYYKALPPWQHAIRLSCLYPLLFAARTLAISRHNHQVLFSNAKMTREEVVSIVKKSTLFGWSNWWVERYFDQLHFANLRV